MSTIDSILTESRVFPPSDEFRRKAHVSGREAYDALYQHYVDLYPAARSTMHSLAMMTA